MEQSAGAGAGEEIDISRAADAVGLGQRDRADGGGLDREGIQCELDVADGALARAGAAQQSAPFEGGAGGGRASGEFAVALQNDLAVGAHVHQQAGPPVIDHAIGIDAGGDVRADVGRDAGQ